MTFGRRIHFIKLLNHHDELKTHQVDGGAEDDCPLVLGDPDVDEEEGDGGGEDDEGVGQDVEGEGGQPPQPGVGGPLQQRLVSRAANDWSAKFSQSRRRPLLVWLVLLQC